MEENIEAQQNISTMNWDAYLSGLESCHFPSLYTGASQHPSKRPLSVRIDLRHLPALQNLSNDGNSRLVTSLQIAWALVLRCYTGLDDVCFGLLELGNTVRASELAQSVFQMPVARVILEDSKAVEEIMDRTQVEYADGSAFRRRIPDVVSRQVHVAGMLCFNTAILLRTDARPAISDSTTAAQTQHQFETLEEVCLSFVTSVKAIANNPSANFD